MKKLMLALLMVTAIPAHSEEQLTLNDIPRVLQALRGCTETKGMFSTTLECKLPKDKLWISVDTEGKLTLFYRKYSSETIYAEGRNLRNLLLDFGYKINQDRENGKTMLDGMAPFLPTQ